jgi:hypothetical protein
MAKENDRWPTAIFMVIGKQFFFLKKKQKKRNF